MDRLVKFIKNQINKIHYFLNEFCCFCEYHKPGKIIRVYRERDVGPIINVGINIETYNMYLCQHCQLLIREKIGSIYIQQYGEKDHNEPKRKEVIKKLIADGYVEESSAIIDLELDYIERNGPKSNEW